jgi:hypothetical protein
MAADSKRKAASIKGHLERSLPQFVAALGPVTTKGGATIDPTQLQRQVEQLLPLLDVNVLAVQSHRKQVAASKVQLLAAQELSRLLLAGADPNSPEVQAAAQLVGNLWAPAEPKGKNPKGKPAAGQQSNLEEVEVEKWVVQLLAQAPEGGCHVAYELHLCRVLPRKGGAGYMPAWRVQLLGAGLAGSVNYWAGAGLDMLLPDGSETAGVLRNVLARAFMAAIMEGADLLAIFFHPVAPKVRNGAGVVAWVVSCGTYPAGMAGATDHMVLCQLISFLATCTSCTNHTILTHCWSSATSARRTVPHSAVMPVLWYAFSHTCVDVCLQTGRPQLPAAWWKPGAAARGV